MVAALALGLVAVVGVRPPGAGAHIVVGSKTVRALVAEADCVVRARIVAAHDVAARSAEVGALDRPSVEAEVLAVLKGEARPGRIRFVQHGHGVATFEPGREHLLFLVDIARHRELDALGAAGAARWVSLQEHDDAHPLDGPEAPVLLAAVRDYVAAGSGATPVSRDAALRAATVRLLASGDPGLAASALRDLVAAPELALITAADRARLLSVVDDPGASIGVRVALLGQLERRGLVDGEARWLGLLADDAPTPALVAAIRAASLDPRPAVRARLLALLASDRVLVAAAAARALGRPGDASAVEPLARALDHSSSRVRQAAIRGLGSTRTPAAIEALEEAAGHHPDAATRRLARAEATKRVAAGVATP